EETARVRAYAAIGDAERVEELFPAFDYAAHEPILIGEEGTNLLPREAYPQGAPLPLPEFHVTTTADPARTTERPGASGEIGVARGGGAELAVAAEALNRAKAALDGLPELLGRGPSVGSNSFVVAGHNTASGRPLLANDPHLTISYPSVWHQVGLHCAGECTLDVAGFSFAGMPGVVIGRNADIAWGLTNLGGDVTDFVVEKNLDAEHYERDGEAVAYKVRTETFEVAGSEPFTRDIRHSVHGPIISDLLLDDAQAAILPGAPDDLSVALEWTALRPGESARAVMALNRAATPQDIAEAAALFEVPAQNIVFATRDGHIGYQAPGRFPIRPTLTEADQSTRAQVGPDLGADGRWPRPGWDSAYDWQGYWASEDMPASLDPPAGFIVAANQSVTEDDLGPYLGSGHDAGFRATQIFEEITDRLEDGGKISVADAEEIMLADESPFGKLLGPYVIAAPASSTESTRAQEVLEDWVARGAPAGTDEPGMTIMSATYAHLLDRMFTARIDGFHPTNSSSYLQAIAGLAEDSPWWDDPDTPEVEGRGEMMAIALDAAVADLHSQLGGPPASWRWGLLHRETPTHDILGGPGVPGPIRNYFNGLPRQVPGGSSIPNAMGFSPALVDGHVDFEVGPGPSMRMVVDMGGTDRWIVSSGVSGHPASPHMDDQLDMWATGRTLEWTFGEPDRVSTLVLTPER
ncbi:MAG: penicillin acylase family protein, partial [Flaviflexus sp.]|nr:penicillin acylase family protein [Flaviflexus sp.]